jgi:hypothetical protein
MRVPARSLAVAGLLALVSLPVHAQTLVEAAAAAKAASATGMGWPASVIPTKVYTNEDLKANPAPAVPATKAAAPAIVPATAVSGGALAENRIKATALLGARLEALRAKVPGRNQLAAQYRDACAGKETSAGWLLKGELITTPNDQTPQCRTIASDLQSQTRAITLEHDALTETARTNGILPGVVRELEIPE